MAKVPSAVWIVDTKKEHLAVDEARKLGLPVIAILDTNCDPDEVDYKIPGNDDAIRSVTLLTRVIADAVAEGLIARSGGDAAAGEQPQAEEPLAEWERELLAGDAEQAAESAAPEAGETAAADAPEAAEAAVEAAEARPPEAEATEAAAPEAEATEAAAPRPPRLLPPRRRPPRLLPPRRRPPRPLPRGRDRRGRSGRAGLSRHLTRPPRHTSEIGTHGELHRR